jgi:hypothetical protein
VTNSKNHHWWPKCVSEFWRDADGCTTRLSPSGEILRLHPKKFGVIGHGHSIKLSRTPGETTVWDYNFESEFQRADDNFPYVIKWLNGLDREKRSTAFTLTGRFLQQAAPEEKLSLLVEGLVSLCIRSPMSRSAAVSAAEHLRGKLEVRERNALVALNIRYRQQTVADAIGTHGKFAIIYSPDREFIFGDGFLHNLTSPAGPPSQPEMLVPLTPRVSVLLVRPSQYTTEPKLSTLIVSAEEADQLNHAVQIYAKEMLFYRSEQPIIADEFRRGEHLRYSGPNRPIDKLIHSIPGVSPRNAALDFLFRGARTD